MITLITNDNTERRFNLNNFERERALYSAWFSMRDDKKFADKKLKITTDKGENLLLKISEIKDCKFEDCIYVEAEVRKPKEKSNPSPDPLSVFMGKLDQVSKEREKRNVEKFFNELKKRNCICFDFNDPFLLQVLENVKKTTDDCDFKIPLYANIYANHTSGK